MRVEETQPVRLHGRLTPGKAWWQDGEVRLWLTGASVGHDPVEPVKRWCLRHLEPSCVRAEADSVVLGGRDFLHLISRLPSAPWPLADDLAVYGWAVGLALEIVQSQDVLPFAAPVDLPGGGVWDLMGRLAQAGDLGYAEWPSGAGAFAAAWMPAWTREELVDRRMVLLSQAERWWAPSAAAFGDENARRLCDAWLCRCVDHFVRQALSRGELLPQDAPAPFRILYRGEPELMEAFARALTSDGALFHADGWLMWRALRRWFAGTGWTPERWADTHGAGRYRLELVLEPPKGNSYDWTVRFWIAHRRRPGVRAPLASWWREPRRVWWIGGERLHRPDRWILPQLCRAAEVWPALGPALQAPAPSQWRVPAQEAYDLFTVYAPRLEAQGISVRLPALKRVDAGDIRLQVQVRRRSPRSSPLPAATARPWFDLAHLADFDWTLAVGDVTVTPEAFARMVEQGAPLLQTDAGWCLVPVRALLDRLEMTRPSPEERSLPAFARLWLWAQASEEETIPVELSFDHSAADLAQFVDALRMACHPSPLPAPDGFRGQLRGYQQTGYAWLVHLRRLGLGGVLADDMGLGKTVQILAYLWYLKETGQARGPHLLVCPTSLLANWRQEMARFVPSLRVHIHHGSARHQTDADGTPRLAAALRRCDVVVTTYGTAVRDADVLQAIQWDVAIADEAQAIKNPDTHQARMLRRLKVRQWVALTGTPVENRLEELWSIVQLVNPGYLGSARWFHRAFADPVARAPGGVTARRLRTLLQPILLRRSKADPVIRRELPEKWEIAAYAALTPEQAALYQRIVHDLFQGLGRPGSIGRRGQILAALTRLKQVCDHPALVAGGKGTPGRSGKLTLLLQRIEEVVAKGEAALVFTQFREMGELLVAALQARFGWCPPFLHGGLGAAKRGELVARFQEGVDPAPVFVLSLKAGGTGLNLTRANHVFHYDRWWNPAVEDQATDRAFRIGQTKDVQVHRLICPGTLEERIDQMIAHKRALTQVVAGTGEGWLTEFDDETLRRLFMLDVEAAVGEMED
ncbi:DEAD/DEAH box helicase [Alicyclobacillus macrosporangiidus]|uniref:Superfamily II DNA or RNA helicase, SNF2 family n=1 Tax=Alicyclobacillus macrosporangiidus TaxID=392015 RepID=A0A1I7FMB6_9BACL|nr:DEAD/DEAH box helicase [Alicyclobacillus macrosporangiidus]SFU37268.1 Superfamily II DNA or RNA helicase, SNF2 family [Alicyclobacillus macrosporangiidus]